MIERTYTTALTKYPRCIQLRIQHALFLLEKMKSNQQALQELAQAEQEKPYLDEQFMIYRYRRLIEQEMFESTRIVSGQQSSGVLVNEITIEGYVKQIHQIIEQITLQNLDFWSQLKEDSPDLMKLGDLGTQLNSSLANLDLSWKKLIRMNLDVPANLLRVYTKFLIDVINDRETAQEVIKKLQVASQ